MQSLISPYWVPECANQFDDRFILGLKPKVVKLFFVGDVIPHLDVALSAATDLVVLRHQSISENWHSRGLRDNKHAESVAVTHAEYWRKLLAPMPSKRKVAVEGLNEFDVESEDNLVLLSVYYAKFIELMFLQGVKTVAGNFVLSKGIDWDALVLMHDVIRRCKAYFGFHEFWTAQSPKANLFKECPWDVPAIVTECGVKGSQQKQGDDYFGQIVDYEKLCVSDGRIVALVPLTHGYYDKKWRVCDKQPKRLEGLWVKHAHRPEVVETQESVGDVEE